jgi:hypothetical protein
LETQKINEEKERMKKEKDDEDEDNRRSGADEKLKVAGSR